MMRASLILIVELILVAVAIFIADFLQANFRIIPRALVALPSVDYSAEDFHTVLKCFLSLHLLAFGLGQLIRGPWKPADARSTANEIFLLIATYSISALTLFLATTVNFDPDLMAAVGLVSVLLFILAHIIASLFQGAGFGALLSELLKSLLSRIATLSGIATLALALTPAVLAYLFTSNATVANVITQMRINISGFFAADPDYQLASVTGSYRFTQPMIVRNLEQDPATLYVLERAGRILSFNYPFDENEQPEVLLDIRDKVGKVEIENGALGFDFHPAFGEAGSANAGYIYLYYTSVLDDRQFNRLSRFDLTPAGLEERSQSELSLLSLERAPNGFHNGGSVDFGPDGYLYFAIGEGVHLSEKTLDKTLRQGIVRIDVDQQGGTVSQPIAQQPADGSAQNYFIPSDNPFVGNPDIRDEYWAIGMRNPYRMDFDSKTGALWVGDVGSTKWEEVNLVKKGGHHQYPYIQGYEETGKPKPAPLHGEEVTPLYVYLHTAYDRAVIGGTVYHGSRLPELTGQYIFADNYSSRIFAMPGDGTSVESVTELARATQYAQRGVSSLSELVDGEILITTLGRSTVATGEILRLEKYDGSVAEVTAGQQDTAIGAMEAQEIFVTNCGRCHGNEGKADGPDTAQLPVAIPDFSDPAFQQSRTDEHLKEVIAKGGYALGLSPLMPPWEGILDEAEIDAMVEFVRQPTALEHNH